MRSRSPDGRFLLVPLDRESAEPLHRQLYCGLREAILNGRVSPGSRLPSTRVLARDLGISRTTVVQAFERLVAEGYVAGRVGSGTRVAAGMATSPRPPRPRVPPQPVRTRRLETITGLPSFWPRGVEVPPFFRPATPALDLFPQRVWQRLVARERQRRTAALDVQDPAGYRPLRAAVADYLRRSRGVRCDLDQVCIVSGTQHALDLAARVLLDPGDSVWLETPGYSGARGVFATADARITPVPVDEKGMDVDRGLALDGSPRLVYLTPACQFPTGVPLAPARRQALLRLAQAGGNWVLEDDYGGDHQYEAPRLPALQGEDRSGRILHAGSFSTSLFPALRLGWLVLPPDLVDSFAAVRQFADSHPPFTNQGAATDFLNQGHFERHLRRMNSVYRERRDTLIAALGRHFGPRLQPGCHRAGLECIAWLPEGDSDVELSRLAAAAGILAIPVSFFSLTPPRRRGLLLGYGSRTPREIDQDVGRLAQAIQPALRRHAARHPISGQARA